MMAFLMRHKLFVITFLVVLITVASCSSYRHCQWQKGDQSKFENDQYALRFIEADDEGWFWDKRQVDSTMTLIRDKIREQDTIVVVFVHGWHHSAECCDENVEGFRNTLAHLHDYLAKHRIATAKFNLVGLYIGWRGQSLIMPLDYFTFWGRKGAAERVGANDLKEFMARLQALFVEFRPDAARVEALAENQNASSPMPEHFLGLVTIGHSFGAQVLIKAIAGPMEDQLQRLNVKPGYLRGATPATPEPDKEFTLTGIGDLVVLVNPATEASQYQRLHVLSQGLKYSNLQTPAILTVSAEDDGPRHRLFTMGRMLGEFFTGKPHKADPVERAVERQALGVYPGQITHRLSPTDSKVRLTEKTLPGDERFCANHKHCDSKWYEWEKPPAVTKPNSLLPADPRLPTFDFSKQVVFNNVELSPLTAGMIQEWQENPADYAKPIDYQPFIVARASSSIIHGHTGIFTEPFIDFLVPYIANIETKSKINRVVKQQKRTSESEQLR
jgi:hypothetical protein